MTAPDTSDRGDAATQGDGAQTWRVLLERASTGERVEVAVDVSAQHHPMRGVVWVTESDDCDLRVSGRTARAAVSRWAQSRGGLSPVEILAPGEPSRAELVAAHADAIARAVAEEREACARLCDEYAASLDADSPDYLEEIDDEHEESYGQFTGALHLAAAIRTRGGAQ